MRRKGWLGGLQRAIKVTVPLEYINGLTRYPEVSPFSQNGRLPHDFSPEFLAEKIKECKVKERQTALKSACWFRSRKLMARKAPIKFGMNQPIQLMAEHGFVNVRLGLSVS